MSADDEKRAAGRRALDFVADGMVIGLGTGSTAAHFVDAVGEKVAAGWNVTCVPTSEQTAAQARGLNIPLATLEEVGHIDVTVDGADEADPQLRLIKGGGGALLREKIVASQSGKMVVISDSSKLVPTLGQFKLPVEIVPFGAGLTAQVIEQNIAQFCAPDAVALTFRGGDGADRFVTDGGHFIVDCACQEITDPEGLADFLVSVPGVVDHGLFIGLASLIVVGEGTDTRIVD